MKKINIGLLLMAFLMACQPQASQQQEDGEGEETDLPAPTSIKPAYASAGQAEPLLQAYLAVKDSFVKSDTAAVNQSVTNLQTRIEAVDSASLPTEAQEKWKSLQAMLVRTTTTLQSLPKLEGKRAAFEDLSKLMYEVVTVFGASATVYKQYCPMALNDKGAYWLSINSEIRNPYFGDKMLECGEVQEVLTFEK